MTQPRREVASGDRVFGGLLKSRLQKQLLASVRVISVCHVPQTHLQSIPEQKLPRLTCDIFQEWELLV
ncbi:MAG: hypothetical protein SWX82_13035 [Cyanobacteriota bacterium]|nr:hypothetical protein [Cyanobacteriota bacterium]